MMAIPQNARQNGRFMMLAQYREMAILCGCVIAKEVLKNDSFLNVSGWMSRISVATFPALLASSFPPYMDIRVNSRKPNLFEP